MTIQYGEPIRWERVSDPSREQQQAVADTVLGEIRRTYAGLEQYGRKGIRRHLRAQRRAERAKRSRGGAPKGAAV